MKDPIELPRQGLRNFKCVNILTGHVRLEKKMTAEMAARINSYHHNQSSLYKWLWDDQEDFSAQLDFDSPILELR